MERAVYTETKIDYQSGEIKSERIIKKKVSTVEQFHQTYTQDIGVLLKCTKGQIDLIVCLMKLGFIEFNTNEIILTSSRRKELSICSSIKINSTYVLMNGLQNKNIIVKDENGKLFLNPKLFFFGYEAEREKMLSLSIHYVLNSNPINEQ
jgi:hypothetical protein